MQHPGKQSVGIDAAAEQNAIFTTGVLVTVVALVFAVGVLVGAVGIGGIVMIPAIAHLSGIDIHTVVASVVFSAIFSGAVGTFMYARHGAIDWPTAAWLGAGAVVGAFAGTWVLVRLPGVVVEGVVAVLVLLTGLHALLVQAPQAGSLARGTARTLVVVGALTGFGSAIGGAGGPLLLIPMLMWLEFPILVAIALGQFIQIPVALAASLGNAINGLLNYELGFLVSVCLMAGVVLGARISVRLPERTVRRTVAVVLVCTALVILGRLALA